MERSAPRDRSTRLQNGHDTRRRRRSGFVAAVEPRLGKISTGQAQNLVRSTQLAILALQRSDALTLFGRLPRTLATVGLGPTHPAMQRLRDTTNLGRNRLDSGDPTRILMLNLWFYEVDRSSHQIVAANNGNSFS